MRPLVLAVAGRLDIRTGGSIYNRRIGEALGAMGWQVDVRELGGGFPFPSAAALEDAARVYASMPDGATVLADGLAFSAMPEVVEAHATRLQLVAIVHLPIAAAVGLDDATAARLAARERRALAAAARIVVTGPGALPLLDPYELDRHDVILVEPGVDPAPCAHGSKDGGTHLLSVATLNAGKGHDVLLHALASIDARADQSVTVPGPPAPSIWRLTCAGSLTRDRPTADRLRTLASDLGLADRVTFAGELNDAQLGAAWDDADVCVVASRRETYGMAAAEALARGVPVVGTATGALPALLATGAGLLVPPGDVAALADALRVAMFDRDRRLALAAEARRVGATLPTWDEAAARMAAVLDGL